MLLTCPSIGSHGLTPPPPCAWTPPAAAADVPGHGALPRPVDPGVARRVILNGILIDSIGPSRGMLVTSVSSVAPGPIVGRICTLSTATRPWFVSVYSPRKVPPGCRATVNCAGSPTRTGAGTDVWKVAVTVKSYRSSMMTGVTLHSNDT